MKCDGKRKISNISERNNSSSHAQKRQNKLSKLNEELSITNYLVTKSSA